MKQILITCALCVLPITANAQDKPADQLLRLFELFSDDTETIIDDLMQELSPMMESFSGLIDDITKYEAPEVLPNGDIIIRRKPDTAAPLRPKIETPKPKIAPKNGQIEL